MVGWIINLWDDARTAQVEREQVPVFDLDGEPVFEVWFWHTEIRRWFVMSTRPDPTYQALGVVYFESKQQLIDGIKVLGGRPRVA